MHTRIGTALRRSASANFLVTVVSVAIVGSDLALVASARDTFDLRMTLAILGCLFYAYVVSYTGDDGASFGFRVLPRQGWAYWIKTTLVLGGVVFALLVMAGGILFIVLRNKLPEPVISRHAEIWPLFLWMCVISPVYEEILYRLVVCPPATAILGAWGGIILTGFLFAGLHILYGRPSPENMAGGFLLAWAFLKSGTLIVPVALHSLGNFCAFCFQVGYFWWWNI